MPRIINYSLFLVILIASNELLAQTSAVGYVLDEFSKPIPFANVLFEGTTIGTITNKKGYFELKSPKKQTQLKVILLGFEDQSIPLIKNTNYLNITLKEGEQLQEVVVIKKPKKHLKKRENPAYKILKEVWKRKANLGLNQLGVYEFNSYSAVELGLNNLDTLFLNKVLGKQKDSIIQIINQNKTNKLFYIPLNLKEQHRKVYGDTKKKKYRSDLKGQRISGIQPNGFFFKRIEKAFKEVDVFQETVVIADRSFSSPLAKTGFFNYDYVLVDSLAAKKGKEYSIYFFPRREGDLAFKGNMTIESPSYALKDIALTINKNINLNFVRNLNIEFEYEKVNDSIYLPAKQYFGSDFTVLTKNTKEKGIYLKKTVFFSDYLLDNAKSLDFYDTKIVYRNEKKLRKESGYWKHVEPESFSTKTRHLLTQLKNNRKVKSITQNINFLTGGYKNITSWLQFGRWWDSFNFNNIEGFRTTFGFRTFQSLDDRFRSSGYVGYGFKSKKVKYGIDARYLISYQPRIMVGAIYSDDFEQLGSSLFSTSPLLDLRSTVRRNLFSRGNNYYLTNEQAFGITTDWEAAKNVHFGFNLEIKKIQSGAPDVYSLSFDRGGTVLNSFQNTLLSAYLQLTPNRNVYGYGVNQKFGKSKFLSISIKYTKGVKGLFNGDFNYDQFQISYIHPIRLGFFGLLRANFELGKTFGKLPNNLLNALPTNQGYSLEKRTFALNNYYDWITDTYLIGHFEQHFNGFILNKIPLFNKLKLRSLATFRFAIGTISQENRLANRSNIIYNAPSETPYFEYGFGIENIGFENLRIFRLDFIWRGALPNGFITNSPGNGLPKFGIRIGVKPEI